MIVFKYTYDKSITSTFSFSFNNGFTPTTTEETSGNLVTVTVESDTPFTTIGIPFASEAGLVAVHYMDLSNISSINLLFERCVNLTDVTLNNSTTKLTDIANTFYFYEDNPHKNPINISFVNCNLSAIPDNLANNFVYAEYKNIPSLTFDNCVLSNGKTMGKIIGSFLKETKLIFKNCTTAPSTSFERMFYGTGRTEVDLSGIDFTNVTSTYLMFSNSQIRKLTLPKGDFYNLTDISMMFEGAYYIEEVDISDFHIMNPVNITQMFVNCRSLKKVNLSGININKSISFDGMFGGSSVCEWFDISNLKAIPSSTTNFWKSQAVVENVGMLYCPANVINTIAPLLVGSGRTCNIYYHDAKLEDLTVDSRFNYIYCEEYHGDAVTTPDDLKLHGLSDVQDTLDLITGTYTQRVKKWNLAEEGYTFIKAITSQEAQGYVRFDFRQPQLSGFGNPYCISKNATHINNLGLPNLTEGVCTNTLGRCLGVATNNAFLMLKLETTDVASYDKAGLDEWIKANNFTVYYNAVFSGIDSSIKTETYQVNVNPLKSYRNGSITTSSQQLTPTLKTTLPISNKFTTTNLSSGQTYNIYFDGTATKLDAGGTIITNPISPCEVECGGTTLTIEGTDVQNVRVLETSVKNEVGSICGTTDVELSGVITSDLEVVTNDIEFSSVGTDNGNINTVDNKLGTINTKGGHSWGAGYFTSNKTYPKGFSLLHIEFDVNMPSNNLMAIINFNNNVSHTYYNFRDLTLDNDTATIAQGQTSGIGVNYSSIVTKGHFSRLVYCFSSQGKINLNINTGSSAMTTASGNNAEGSTSGYTACATDGVTISNFKIKVIENYPDATVSSQITSLLRTNNGLTVIWQDMDMSIGQTISKLEQPIKLRSLGTTYDSYNPVTGELTKRIGVSETDGSYSVLSSPIVENISMGKTIVNIFNFEEEWINRGLNTSTSWQLTDDGDGIYTLKALQNNATARVWFSLLDAEQIVGEELTTIMEVFKNTSNKSIPYWVQIRPEHETNIDFTFNAGETGVKIIYGKFTATGRAIDFQNIGINSEFQFRVTIVRGLYPNVKEGFGTSKIIQVPPHLYTNGQVKVYSDSDVYPTTILNGQSTNNYEVNELNKSNNYTIRYEGECESINLNGKSNEQGTNRIVNTSTNGSGNLTFVNDNGDIDNVLLVQNDVREQEINHFNGLQTVEVSGMLIETSKNMWWNDWIEPSQYGASYQVDSPEFISVQPGETIYVVADNNNYTSLFEFDENYNMVNQSNNLILGHGSVPTPIRLDNGYYKNYKILSENTRYIKFTIPASTASNAKNITQWSIVSFTRADIGNVPLYTNNTPYRGSIINLPQPVQLNGLPDGTCDTYNPITGEYVQNVGVAIMDENGSYGNSWSNTGTTYPVSRCTGFTVGDMASRNNTVTNVLNNVHYGSYGTAKDYEVKLCGYGDRNTNYRPVIDCGNLLTDGKNNVNGLKAYLKENPIILYYQLVTPIVTQLTPIEIPTFEGGVLQLITTDGKVFPMVEYSMPTNNRYDTSSWEAGVVYTQRNMTEAYFNESTTPMTPTETMTLTTDHISSGSIILNDNGNGLIVLKGNYTGRDIPYFTGMRSVEAIEVETTPSPDQPLFGKGGRK